MQTQTRQNVQCIFYKRLIAGVTSGRIGLVLFLPLVLLGILLSSGLAGTLTQVHASSQEAASKGHNNPFPYGSCTWWADQRYHQLTGIYVPWTTRADAWEWTARARQFHWHVSKAPAKGSIIDLQPWVQYAYGLGHVAVVEKVLANGRVIASNMSWGAHPRQVINVEFSPGPGVTFITY